MGAVVPFPGPRRARRVEPLWREVIGQVLREERQDRDERLVHVARRAGVSPQYLSELERGRKDGSSETLGAVVGALDRTVAQVTSRAAARLARGPVCLAA